MTQMLQEKILLDLNEFPQFPKKNQQDKKKIDDLENLTLNVTTN